MLLSILISFLLAKRFGRVTYVLLTTVSLVSISFLSFGLPDVTSSGRDYPTPSYYPLPFSFPFYSIDNAHPSWGMLAVLAESYKLCFLTFRIAEFWGFYPLSQTSYLITLFRFYSYFLLVNVGGAIFGYWISKATFMKEILCQKKYEVRQA